MVLIVRKPTGRLVGYVSANQSTLLIRMNSVTGDKVTIRISSMNGKRVYQNVVSATTQHIPIGRFAKGNYVIEVWQGSKRAFVQQFVKP